MQNDFESKLKFRSIFHLMDFVQLRFDEQNALLIRFSNLINIVLQLLFIE